MKYLSGLNYMALWALLVLAPCPAFSNSALITEEARAYRDKGYEAQQNGDYKTAAMFYEKAVAMDPYFATACNDLGTLYELSGDNTRALLMYRKALQIDANYADAYYNIASLYEEEGDFLKAAQYWKQRVRLGSPNEPATVRAKKHLLQICQIYPGVADEILFDLKELDKPRPTDLNQQVREYIGEGKRAYKSGDYLIAMKNFSEAAHLDPRNREIQDLLEKSQKAVLLQ